MSGLGFRTPLGGITGASARQANGRKMNNMTTEDWESLENFNMLPKCDLNGKKIG